MTNFKRSNLLLAFSLFFFLSGSSLFAQDQKEEIFSLYFIRHAEKDLSDKEDRDPPLTKCGAERAESLANFLSSVDIQAAYSTNFERTRKTAEPLAKEKDLEIQLYDHKKPDQIVQLLLARKQNAVIMGHSNSTGILAGLIIDQEIGSMDESIYDRIYQVIVHGDSATLYLLHSNFICSVGKTAVN